MQSKNYLNKYLFLILTVCCFLFPVSSSAQSVDELQKQIEERKQKQEQLDRELAEQKAKLEEVSRQKNTLQTTVNTLVSTEKKITSDIKHTENKIDISSLTLEKLAFEIEDKTKKISDNAVVLADALKNVEALESTSFIEKILIFKSFSDFFNNLNDLNKFKDSVNQTVVALKDLNQELRNKYEETTGEKYKLEELKKELAGEKEAVAYTKKEKEQVLAVTKNTEAEYQRIVKEKEVARAKIESELSDLETKLQYTLDPSSLPGKGSGVLRYPIEPAILTQGYGLTSFALSGAYGYDANGQPKPHRALDFRASIGTKIYSSADGVVRESYNMDSIPGCRSYGQWILIDHNNGLSTLYTHLSVRSVSAGQSVKAGELIGLAGQSGYATGPHLHFGVFPKDGVNVQKFTTSIGCKNALIPLAAINAYLNPLDYLR